MDSLHIRNYLVGVVVGIFCLLNANIVSAQTATNVECFWCIGPGEVGQDAVFWGSLNPTVRNRIIALEQRPPLRVVDANGLRVGGHVLSVSTRTIISPSSRAHYLTS